MIREVTATELKARRDRGETPLVIDVREDWNCNLRAFPASYMCR